MISENVNKKIESFVVSCKRIFESQKCDDNHVVILQSTPDTTHLCV